MHDSQPFHTHQVAVTLRETTGLQTGTSVHCHEQDYSTRNISLLPTVASRNSWRRPTSSVEEEREGQRFTALNCILSQLNYRPLRSETFPFTSVVIAALTLRIRKVHPTTLYSFPSKKASVRLHLTFASPYSLILVSTAVSDTLDDSSRTMDNGNNHA
ncbi:hypothetical protein BJ508DRAFT_314740 [Ascobolus immersus RN42]|uniref:Uncharacterized protein n=1 Tax=Ascobolus immersus RN42 TaxID=1160509 RepID=A0A3N4HDZ3_ASCIM|nr:hypothetical protein BJ508DRAFT_314740 [Ascobolus immersus RN42]